MKNRIFFLPLLISTFVSAQFTINGTLDNYTEKPVIIKIYENGSERAVKRLETNSAGKFSYRHPSEYTGKIIYELNKGAFESISDNTDINFQTDINDPSHVVNYSGGVNSEIKEAFASDDKKHLRDYTLVELLKLYQPQDDFYKALQKEIDRIDKIQTKSFSNEAIQYYVNAKNELGQYNANKFSAKEVLDKSRHHLVMDNMYLENFGLLQEFLSNYISYSITGATSREDAALKIEKALDELISEAQTDTSRGQAILTNVIPMLESNGFESLSKKFLTQAENLTCEITDDLRNLIEGKQNVTIGNKVPDIEFGNKIKGAQSLYAVKADKKLIVFWASWCPHCMNEIPHIKTFYEDFSAQGGEIIAISLDMEKEPFQKATAGTKWINYSDFMKWESPLVSQFGITSTPTMILVDKDNKVIKTGTRISEFL